MYPDPNFAKPNILGHRFTLMDGIVGLAFDARAKVVYFQPLATDRLFSIKTSVLRAGPSPFGVDLPVKLVGKKSSQGIGLAVSPIDGSIYFSPMSETAVAKWNPVTNNQREAGSSVLIHWDHSIYCNFLLAANIIQKVCFAQYWQGVYEINWHIHNVKTRRREPVETLQIRRGGRGARGARGGAKRFMRPEKGKFKPKNTSLPSLRAPNWNNLDLEPFQKNFYREHPNVMNRLRQDVERFRNKHEITVQGLALNPIESFDEVFMPDYVAREIRNQGYNRPTPIQSQTWPIAFSGYNLVGIAQTGSGKTLAYILPAIIHINNQPNIKPGDGPIAVVLAPTRELAVQIEQVAIDFGSSTHIRTVCTVGGIDKKPQEAALLKGCEIVVATPGRLLDFLSANVTNMKRCTYLVLDEADRMLDMGFEAQIRDIISQIRPDKQILMWSATWPLEIRRLAEDFLGNYIQVNIGSLELSANHNIKQFIHICQENEKSSKLQLLLRQIYQANNPGKILIFVSKKKRADMISKYINNFGVACESLHGDKAQSQRTKILDDFRSGRSNIIVATDVAARGLDVDGIMYVINLDFPKLIEDYVHRIGRCGRCDRMGISYAFFTTNDAKQAKDLIAILNEANQPVDAKLQEMAFNPQKPEKIDKKQRRINENSGFNVSVPEKRRHDGRNANFSAAGPSNANAEDAYVGEPDIKRERIVEPEQSGRGVMFNHNNDRDFMEERSMNRGYMDIPATAYNSNQLDNHSIGLRPFEARNSDRFQSDDRATNRDLVEERPTATRHLMERRREDFERSITGRAPQNPNDGMDEYRMRGEGPNVRQRLLSPHFERGEPTIGLGRGDPAIGLGRGDPAIGLGRGDPAIGLGRSDPAIGLGRGDPAIGLGRGDPAIGLGRGDPAIGLNRMRNLRESSFDRQENDFGRRGNDFHRQVDDLDRRRTDFDCRQTDFDRHRTDFVRQENDSDLRVTDFDRRENDIDRRENDIGRRGSNFGRRENDFDRLSDINHFHDQSNDVRDSFGGGQRHIRDGLLDSMDRDVDRSGPIFDSSVSDRRNFERELMDNRDIRALNFEDVLQIRTYDALSERRSVLQEFRPISPNSMLDRSDISADRFLNRPRGDDPFDSLHQFGSRRGNSRDRTDDSGFNMSDRRNDFIDEIDRNQTTSSRWNNDFAARDPQDRRDFNNDSRRTINFSLDGETNFNFTRNNDYGNDDGFRNRNRRDFKRPNQDDRFNCFN